MVKKQRKEKAEVNVIKNILRLIKNHVPVLFLWMNKGELKKIGSHNMLDWFESLKDESKEQLSAEMVRDLMGLNNNTEELLHNPDNVPVSARASTLYKSVTEVAHSSGIAELPWPLTLMSKKQLVKYVSDLCANEAKKDGARLIYGGEEWRPSFWLEELWNWSHLTTGLWKTKESMYTGPGTWSDFLSSTIRRLFELKGLDPEKHVEDLKGKTKVLEKKKRIRGIHEPVKISRQPSVSLQQDQVLEESLQTQQTNEGDVNLTEPSPSGSFSFTHAPPSTSNSLPTSPVPVASGLRDSLPVMTPQVPLIVFCSAPELCMCNDCTSPFLLQGPQDQLSIPDQDHDYSPPGQHASSREDVQVSSQTQPITTRQDSPAHPSTHAPRSNKIIKPRRTVGKSPFKTCSSKQTHARIPMPDSVLMDSISDTLVVPTPLSNFGQDHPLEDQNKSYQSVQASSLIPPGHAHGDPSLPAPGHTPVDPSLSPQHCDHGDLSLLPSAQTQPHTVDHLSTVVPVPANLPSGEPPQFKTLRARSSKVKITKLDRSKKKVAGLKNKSVPRKQIILSERRMCKKKNAQNDSNDSFVSKPFVIQEFIKDKEDSGVAMKSDIYHVFPIAPIEPSLSDLLAHPSQSEREKEAYLEALDAEIKEDKVRSDIEMNRVDKVINAEKARQKSWRKRLKENRILRKQMEAELSESLTKELFHKNMEYITNIYSGVQSSARRDEFMKGGIFRDRLTARMITSPFNDQQLDVVLDEMEKLWMTTKKEKMENSDFIWKVCLPETLIKVQ